MADGTLVKNICAGATVRKAINSRSGRHDELITMAPENPGDNENELNIHRDTLIKTCEILIKESEKERHVNVHRH